MLQAIAEFVIGSLLILGAFFNAGAEKLSSVFVDSHSGVKIATSAKNEQNGAADTATKEISPNTTPTSTPVTSTPTTTPKSSSATVSKPSAPTVTKVTNQVSAKIVETSLPPPIKNLNISLPTGLHATGLDEVEIIALTNIERIKNNLPPLKPNLNLRAMAEAKAVDMINKQYFDHVSPSGTTIGDLAVTYRYKYLHIGENLALGDFASSSHVVDGWMNSPGHRANILGNDFAEIGVAVLRGKWEGREVWWAVQEFGKPYPICAEPSSLDRKKIEIYEEQLSQMRISIENLKDEIESYTTEDDAYRQKIKDYNTIIDLYNKLLKEEKDLVFIYNEQIKTYNACMNV